ncbi:diaminopimelate epimerase [Gynurincola endophyticus]|jgi:diaminopimelate epimerase|uniref:diaminopimelate epimerase n=1 Tax=Gynurincola endophyticus TaxID=2479004 RepID=UPI000F8EF0DA|nr:diaminopimelate epimerase [Gynurincola endophyticus]
MVCHFYKYQGTGNDFVILDNRTGLYDELTEKEVHFLCNRHFGVGADGLMLLNEHPRYDFAMKYYNADGKEGSMCGNGGRSLVKFAYDCGIIRDKYHFIAVDGEHEASIDDKGIVSLKMSGVSQQSVHDGNAVLNTGSPHYVRYVSDIHSVDVYNIGKSIRYSDDFPEGINVNFIENINPHAIKVRTYERGVEDETLSCGTGVTACAITHAATVGQHSIQVSTKGGVLQVSFHRHQDGTISDIWLTGPASLVFEGNVHLNLANQII